MKKSLKSKTSKVPKQPKKAKPDIAELLTKLEQKMVILEMKVDVLIERLTIKPPVPEPKHQTAPMQQRPAQQPQGQNDVKRPAGNNGRVMHKAVCADCGKDCEVPFQPREGRDVYCKECFSKRKSGGKAPAQVNGNVAPAEVKPVQTKSAPAAPAQTERKKWGNVKRKGSEKTGKKAKKR